MKTITTGVKMRPINKVALKKTKQNKKTLSLNMTEACVFVSVFLFLYLYSRKKWLSLRSSRIKQTF